MPEEDNNLSKNFELHENEKFILKKQKMEKDHRDLVNKSLSTRNDLLKHTLQVGLFVSELSSSLREVRISE